MHTFFIDTPVGTITVSCDGRNITHLDFGKITDNNGIIYPVEQECKNQLEEYFSGSLHDFSVPVLMEGTVFQKKVWTALKKIPYGKTASYSEIASMAGSPDGCRAVGQAIHANPVAIIVPCHRVIRSDGTIGGFAGGIQTKLMLLELEGVSIKR